MKKLLMVVAMTFLAVVNLRTWAAEDMQSNVTRAMENFRSSRNYGEISIQQLLNLLRSELRLVHQLMNRESGCQIESFTRKRNKKLDCSIPSVVNVYDAVMDLATYDENINPRNLSLAHRDRMLFLRNMEQVLMSTIMELQNDMSEMLKK